MRSSRLVPALEAVFWFTMVVSIAVPVLFLFWVFVAGGRLTP